MEEYVSSQVYVNKYRVDGNTVIEETPDGLLPAYKVEYPDGSKFIALIPRAHFFSFEAEEIQFIVEQYMWNPKFGRWDTTDSDKFTNSMITITNRFLVDATTGVGENQMTNAEKENTTLIGEYKYWLANLGKTIILPQLLNAIKKKFEFVPVVEPEPIDDQLPPQEPTEEPEAPVSSGSTEPVASGTTEP